MMPRRAVAIVAVLVAIALFVTWWLASRPSAPSAATKPSQDEASDSREPTTPGTEHVPFVAPPTATQAHHAPPLSSGSAVDKEQREKMRDAIWRAWGRPERVSTAAAGANAPPLGDPPGEAGTMEPKYIRERVRGDFFPLAGECYDRALKKDPKLAGKLVVHFVIVGDQKIGGIVESVEIKDESTLRDPELLECMRESLLSVTFKPPEHGGWVSVTYPIEFSPEDPDGGDAG